MVPTVMVPAVVVPAVVVPAVVLAAVARVALRRAVAARAAAPRAGLLRQVLWAAARAQPVLALPERALQALRASPRPASGLAAPSNR